MGGDGGVIANQRRFMRACADSRVKEESKNIRDDKIERTRYCSYSAKLLQEPIVACELGNLYNKDAIITALLEKSLASSFSHIRGLKDAKTLIFTPNPDYAEQSLIDDRSAYVSKYICPVTRQEFNGLMPFVFIWSSGYVISEKAIKEVGVSSLQGDYGPFTAEDVTKLLPSDEDLVHIRAKMHEKRESSRLAKDTKKRKLTNEPATADIDGIDNAIDSKPKVNDPKGAPKEASVKKKISLASAVASEASASIENQTSKSDVYKRLFHKGQEADKFDRDLFMSVAGIRYTLR